MRFLKLSVLVALVVAFSGCSAEKGAMSEQEKKEVNDKMNASLQTMQLPKNPGGPGAPGAPGGAAPGGAAPAESAPK